MRIRCLTIFRIHKYSIHFCVIPLYIFLVTSFAQYKEYMNCLILFSTFSDLLPAFACVRATVNRSSICLGVNILRLNW